MLALVPTYRPYLYGRRFQVRTDHNSLKWLHNFHEPEGQVARWLEVLSEFDFDVLHRPGKKHANADALSCLSSQEDQTNTHTCSLEMSTSWVPTWTPEEMQDLPGGGTNKRLQLADDVLTGLHSSPVGGHMGLRKTLEKVRSRFYWVGQRRDVCNNCDKCCSRKSPNKCPRAPLQIDLPRAPFERAAMDILGPLPETRKGNKYILVIGDYFTKWKEAFPMRDMGATTVANIFI